MKLTITDDTMAYMKKRLAGANAYLLTANDGSNNFSEGALRQLLLVNPYFEF
ncbi:hypothetical protein FRFR103141_00005 [Fructilactobacillus fructivorans]|uniref:hypothetical protein n=1 Tax=Fructilactobacillus fructivorans TaxID=1614 RepID=UPI000ACAA2CA|nr:hypothetical protein [Fructilactobacillus fructivorans]